MPKKEKKNIGTSFNILSFEGKQMSLYEQDNKQSFLQIKNREKLYRSYMVNDFQDAADWRVDKK